MPFPRGSFGPLRGADVVLAAAGGPPTIDFPEIPPLIDAIGPRILVPMNYLIPREDRPEDPAGGAVSGSVAGMRRPAAAGPHDRNQPRDVAGVPKDCGAGAGAARACKRLSEFAEGADDVEADGADGGEEAAEEAHGEGHDEGDGQQQARPMRKANDGLGEGVEVMPNDTRVRGDGGEQARRRRPERRGGWIRQEGEEDGPLGEAEGAHGADLAGAGLDGGEHGVGGGEDAPTVRRTAIREPRNVRNRAVRF